MMDTRVEPKAERELTLAEKVDKLFEITQRQGEEIGELRGRTNTLRDRLREVSGSFGFDDEPKDLREERYHGPEGRSSRTGRDGFG
jgi:hypothetical protein